MQSPPQQARPLPPSSSGPNSEPLLSLLTTSHPLIGSTINTSLSAYSASKNYSPRFKSSAEYVERRFTPVVNTVGSVGRITGVEGGVRWFLGGRRPSHHSPSDPENGVEASHKRRKVGTEERPGHVSHDLYSYRQSCSTDNARQAKHLTLKVYRPMMTIEVPVTRQPRIHRTHSSLRALQTMQCLQVEALGNHDLCSAQAV